MAIRFGSSDPKIWLHFCTHLTTMIIRYIQNASLDLISLLTSTLTSMHNYALIAYLFIINHPWQAPDWSRNLKYATKYLRVSNFIWALPTFGVMGNMLSFHKRLEDATTSTASGQ